jgi:hypothetical protein
MIALPAALHCLVPIQNLYPVQVQHAGMLGDVVVDRFEALDPYGWPEM